MTAIRELPLKNGWLRVLGIDPAAVGPTGYGIVESDGRAHRVVLYGAQRIAAKRLKESPVGRSFAWREGGAMQPADGYVARNLSIQFYISCG